jgi:hypothetical protein
MCGAYPEHGRTNAPHSAKLSCGVIGAKAIVGSICLITRAWVEVVMPAREDSAGGFL